MKNIFWGIVILLFSGPLFAQTDIDLEEEDLLSLLETEIVTVSKRAENLFQAPAIVIILTADEIIRRGYLDLEQVLHDLPGFDISRGNGTVYSQIYQRGYRSNNTDRTLLLIDGIEENDLWKGAAWLSRQYPLSNIKRIEIIYGPGSTLYGANAFVGVINIITKNPVDVLQKGGPLGINCQINYGTWNTKYADLTVAGKAGNVHYMLSGRAYYSEEMDLSGYPDWDYKLDAYDLAYYQAKLGTDDVSLAQLAQTLDREGYYQIRPETGNKGPQYSNTTDDWLIYGKLNIENFYLGFQTWRRAEGYGAWYTDDYESGPVNKAQWVPSNTFLYIKYEKQLSDKFFISSFTRYKIHELDGDSQENYFRGYFNGEYDLDDLTDPNGPTLSNWEVTWWYVFSEQLRTELKTVFKPTEKINFVTGLEYRRSYIQGAYITSDTPNPSETGFIRDEADTGFPGGNHYKNVDTGLYALLSYAMLKQLTFTLGGRLDNNEIRTTGGYGTVFTPRAAVVATPGKFILKAIYSEAFKDADNWTKYSTTPGRLLPNPSLKPERVKNFECSVSWQISRHFIVDVIGYHALYDNVAGTANVTLPDGTETTQHQAIGSLQISGMMSNFLFIYKDLTAYANYTFTEPKNEDTDLRIGDIARHQVNLGLNMHLLQKLNLNVRLNYVGEKETGKNTTISTNPLDKIDAYTVISGAITYYNIMPGFSLQMVVNNIADVEYFHPGVRSADGDYYAAKCPQNERNFMMKILYNY
ncbi:TonB-dependent receptor plug domain-containing protein [candidate division CSSED10-310 bacterium]|uniref:TonB-dependent receptor plug domain-containing protein n=1 Tax=candidate division CSSED10-310 bacterium TaxID=2855610 RepID=A0ABV6Z0X3_UNCC1